jgi:hypothetical protein
METLTIAVSSADSDLPSFLFFDFAVELSAVPGFATGASWSASLRFRFVFADISLSVKRHYQNMTHASVQQSQANAHQQDENCKSTQTLFANQ